jgi:prephenate dehydrogenase
MSYAIIGFGKIGHALARAFARNGIEVSVATTRDPESFASDAAAIGPTIIPKTLAEAVKADIIFLAVRFEAHPDVAKALPTWQGKTVIDVTNAYRVPPEELGGQPSSKFVAHAFTGARLDGISSVAPSCSDARMTGCSRPRRSTMFASSGCNGWRRANAINCRVNAAAFSDAA